MTSFTEDHLVEQLAIHLMPHKLGWGVGMLNFECWILDFEWKRRRKAVSSVESGDSG